MRVNTALVTVPAASVVDWLVGKKTYIAAGVGILAVFVNHFVHVPGMSNDPANWLNDIYSLILVLTGRAALARIEAKVS